MPTRMATIFTRKKHQGDCRCWPGRGKREPSSTAGENVKADSFYGNSQTAPQKVKQTYSMTQQSHSWACAPKNAEQGLRQILQTRARATSAAITERWKPPNAHQRTDGQTNCGCGTPMQRSGPGLHRKGCQRPLQHHGAQAHTSQLQDSISAKCTDGGATAGAQAGGGERALTDEWARGPLSG